MPLKKIHFIVLAIVSVILLPIVLREGGCITSERGSATYTEFYEAKYNSHFQWKVDGKDYSSDSKTNASIETKTEQSFYNYGFHTSPKISVFKDVNDRLSEMFEKEKYAKIEIKSLELSGPYMFPIYKFGKCNYQLDATVYSKDGSVLFSGLIDGKVKFSNAGFSSVTELKERLSKQIAKTVYDQLNVHIKSVEENNAKSVKDSSDQKK